jgi:dihydrofolate reductase
MARRLVLHMQTTLDGRIACPDGSLWEPFAWGDEEMACVSAVFERADTWVMGRVLYEAVVPWWDAVADGKAAEPVSEEFRRFATKLRGMTKLVFSRTLGTATGRVVIHGDLAAQLRAWKASRGRDGILSAGPATLAPLLAAPGLVDELFLGIHPALLAAGARLFDGSPRDHALRLLEARSFASGCVLLRYAFDPGGGVRADSIP